MADTRRFLRDNAVLVAAFVLPAIVAALFIVATAIPKWTVPLPQHDLVFRLDYYDSPPPEVYVDFVVRDGQLWADVRPFPKPANPNQGVVYPQRWKLLLFDHAEMRVREISQEGFPQRLPGEQSVSVPITDIRGRVIPGDVAPDGYRVVSLNTGGGGGGIVNDLFGMNRRYRRGIAIGRDGRTIELELPAPYRDNFGTIVTIGWIAESR